MSTATAIADSVQGTVTYRCPQDNVEWEAHGIKVPENMDPAAINDLGDKCPLCGTECDQVIDWAPESPFQWPHPRRPLATVVAWDRGEAGFVSRDNILERYSRQHVVFPPSAVRTLCGARWAAAYECSGDSRRCTRCFPIAAKRGLANDYGEPIR